MLSSSPTIDWELMLDTILSGRCILFLGPEIFTNKKGISLDQQLLDYLDVENDPDIKVYQDGLFFFRIKQKRTATYLKIRRFFQEGQFPETEALLEKIAHIPFHFIIIVTPDNKLARTFDYLNLRFNTEFYWKKHPPDSRIAIPNTQQPLLYNLLGSIETPESLVLTHDDLFDYIESMFQTQILSNKLKNHIIHEAWNIVFLGIPFDRWYMQLLLRILYLHKDEEFMRFAATQELNDEVSTLCKEQFKITFVPNRIEGFVDELYARCAATNRLRQVKAPQRAFVENLVELFRQNRIEEVLERLHNWLYNLENNHPSLLEDTTLLVSRFKGLSKKINRGTIRSSEADVESNKIRKALLDVLKEAKALE